jgi:DNA-binding response OmpR family regulator
MKDYVLCVEDDLTIQALVSGSLKEHNVICVRTIKEAESALNETSFSALLVDIQLPDGDGLRFLTQVTQSEKYCNIPVLIMSDHAEISNKVMAFTFGAEDFIPKPFDPIELHARVNSKIKKRQLETQATQTKKVGNILIDLDRQKAFVLEGSKERDLQLTGIELKILTLLTKRMEQVYSREQMLNHVWGETFVSDRTVDSHIAHLRQKIENTEVVVETVKSFGYRAVIKKKAP